MRRRLTGFTLTELLAVLGIMGVLAVLGAPSFTNLISSNRTKSAASDLQVALVKARSEAVKRNASVTLLPNAGGWQSGWQILDASNSVLETRSAVRGVTITGGPASVVFQSSGRIQGNAASSFLITSTGTSAAQRCVTAATSGRSYVKSSAC
jgi:type IV fimbrial biogenesis protein FimT